MFDVVGHISKVFKVIPNKCYTGNNDEILKVSNFIINDNQETLISNVKVQCRDETLYNLSNSSLYKHVCTSCIVLNTYYSF